MSKIVPFSLKQHKILKWWQKDSPYKDYNGIICDGAVRAGKTFPMAISFIAWAMECYEDCNFALCSKSVTSFRRNIWSWLKPFLLGKGYYIEEKITENIISIIYAGKTNNFYVFGGLDESSQDVIQGVTLAGILFDEAALMPESFINQGTARGSVEGSKWWFNCNPSHPEHWFLKNWILKKIEKKLLHLHFSMSDNLSLSENTLQKYKTLYSGVFYQRFILGEWVAAEGLIYSMFTDDLIFNDSDLPPKLSRQAHRYICIDYGTINPCVFLDVWDDGKTVWVINEYHYDSSETGIEKQEKTDAQYLDDLKVFIGKDYPMQIIIDPSAASFKACIRQAGYVTTDADNEVLDGIRKVSTMLQTKKLKIHKRCIKTIGEARSYAWDLKRKDMAGKEQPLKVNDHAMDALRYFVNTKIPEWRLTA